MAHLLPIRLEEAATKKIEAEANKLLAEAQRIQADREPVQQPLQAAAGHPPPEAGQRRFQEKRDAIPRPRIEENVTESNWSFFLAQWKRYVATTSMEPQHEVHHLWAACSESLQRALHNGGAGKLEDPKSLLSTIKLLAVKRRNNLVNIVELQRMGQQHNESITAFSTRLNGQADVCDLFVECSTCAKDISFKEKVIMYQFVRGLADVHAQERILEAAAQVEGGELSLVRVLKLAEAFEMGKQSQEMVNKSGQLSRLSDYQRNKRNTRQDSRTSNSNHQGNKNSRNDKNEKNE